MDQGAGAEPRLGQRRQKLRGAIVGQNGSAEITQLLQSNSHAEKCVRVARVADDGALKRAYGVRHMADLEQGKAEVVLDDGVGRLH